MNEGYESTARYELRRRHDAGHQNARKFADTQIYICHDVSAFLRPFSMPGTPPKAAHAASFVVYIKSN